MQRKEWSRAEVKVLVGIFFSQSFSSGDDESPECQDIARAFNRNGGTIDRQWRNINDYRNGKPSERTGYLIKEAVDDWLDDPKGQRNLARLWCDRLGWPLKHLIKEDK